MNLNMQKAIKIGISDYLLKPVSSAGLIDALKRRRRDPGREGKIKAFGEVFCQLRKYTEFLDKTDYSGVDRKLINDF